MADSAMLSIAQKRKYYVNLVENLRRVNILESIDILCYNVTKLLKKKGLHKANIILDIFSIKKGCYR